MARAAGEGIGARGTSWRGRRAGGTRVQRAWGARGVARAAAAAAWVSIAPGVARAAVNSKRLGRQSRVGLSKSLLTVKVSVKVHSHRLLLHVPRLRLAAHCSLESTPPFLSVRLNSAVKSAAVRPMRPARHSRHCRCTLILHTFCRAQWGWGGMVRGGDGAAAGPGRGGVMGTMQQGLTPTLLQPWPD